MIGAAAILPFAAAAIWRLVVGLQVHSVTPLFRPVRCGPGMLSCAVETLAVASNAITVLVTNKLVLFISFKGRGSET
jgi:hypothetical protein